MSLLSHSLCKYDISLFKIQDVISFPNRSSLQFASRSRRSVLCGVLGHLVQLRGNIGVSVCGPVSLDLSRKAVCVGSLPQGLIHTLKGD